MKDFDRMMAKQERRHDLIFRLAVAGVVIGGIASIAFWGTVAVKVWKWLP